MEYEIGKYLPETINAIAPLVGAALVTGGTALASSIGSWIQGKRQAKKERQANREMAKYAYSKDLEQWNRQNEYNRAMWDLQNTYNTPASQMRRFKEAGLNPNLIYGRGEAGTAGSVGSSTMSQYNAPRQQYQTRPMDIGTAISQYQDFKMKSAQIDNVNEQTNTQAQKTQLAILNKHLLSGKMFSGYRYKLEGSKKWQNFRESLMGQMAQQELNRTQATANQISTRTAINRLELEWWKSIKGIHGATGIARILRLLGGR